MPKKKPNKFLKINGKVVTLPKKALGNGSEKLAKDFLKAKEQGLINAEDSKFPRHLRKIAE